MRYFIVTHEEKVGDYSFQFENVFRAIEKDYEKELESYLLTMYENSYKDGKKIVINHGDIIVNSWEMKEIIREEYELISNYITHI